MKNAKQTLNDAQSLLNPTTVNQVLQPSSEEAVCQAIHQAEKEGLAISVAGGRHAMGGQQFLTQGLHLDTTGLKRILALDPTNGHLTVQGGIMWPEIIRYLHDAQVETTQPWAIRQKQTGVDRVSLAGSLGANIHGRGLRMGPIVSDIESFRLIDAEGQAQKCSRQSNPELFSHAIGGYGLFGIITEITLRLAPRQWLQRTVEAIPIRELPDRATERINAGHIYGDCQFAIDLSSPAAEHEGIFSCYRPVDPPQDAAQPKSPHQTLASEGWADLYALARTDKRAAFAAYQDYYLKTSGQIYHSDQSQLSSAFDGYSAAVDPEQGTEMITEVYIDPEALIDFLAACRADFVEHNVDLMYGTIRLIQPDTETSLPWAQRRLACIVCNLHVSHTASGIAKAKKDFQRIIDRAIENGDHYYLTYHRWARLDQVLHCYPDLPKYLARKRKLDPQERFQSDWYQHQKTLLANQS